MLIDSGIEALFETTKRLRDLNGDTIDCTRPIGLVITAPRISKRIRERKEIKFDARQRVQGRLGKGVTVARTVNCRH